MIIAELVEYCDSNLYEQGSLCRLSIDEFSVISKSLSLYFEEKHTDMTAKKIVSGLFASIDHHNHISSALKLSFTFSSYLTIPPRHQFGRHLKSYEEMISIHFHQSLYFTLLKEDSDSYYTIIDIVHYCSRYVLIFLFCKEINKYIQMLQKEHGEMNIILPLFSISNFLYASSSENDETTTSCSILDFIKRTEQYFLEVELRIAFCFSISSTVKSL